MADTQRQVIFEADASMAGALIAAGSVRAIPSCKTDCGLQMRGAVGRDETILRLDRSADKFHMTWAMNARLLINVVDDYGWLSSQSL